MKFRVLLIVLVVAFLLWVLATAVLAQEEIEVPAPYAGLTNPFPWSDASVQAAGQELYQKSCSGCHGGSGGNIAMADFSAAGYPRSLEARPDLYFWVLSEGRLDRGMPPYKSSLSEEQRWQVLTYLWSLGAVAPSEVPPPAEPPAEGEEGSLLLTAPRQAQSGQPLTLTATLQDNEGRPIKNATVKFLMRVDFFYSGLMEIGEAVTSEQGVAVLEYSPRQTGDIQVVARYETIETTATLTVAETDEPFYQAEAGIRLPALGQDVLIGPTSAVELEDGFAPMTAIRLPGGILSWLLLVVATVMLIWVTYFRVLYQVLRIPIVSEIEDTDTRRVPLAGLAIVVALGILLVLMLITGPYTHFHLLR